MTNEQFLSIFGSIDETLLRREEKAHKRPVWIRAVSVAACLFLVLGVYWAVMENAFTEEGQAVPCLLPSEYYFTEFNTVAAKVLRVLPDLYEVGGDSWYGGVSLIELEIVDVIRGTEFPETVFAVTGCTNADVLTRYDYVVFPIKQISIENDLIYNLTTGETEIADCLFECYADASGAAYAFTNGKLNESLWEQEGWSDDADYMQRRLSGIEHSFGSYDLIELTRNMSYEQFKSNLQKFIGQFDSTTDQYGAVTGDQLWQERFSFLPRDKWDALMDYVKPFENSVFMQGLTHDENSSFLSYIRHINGFWTNEQIHVNSYGKAEHVGEPFTAEELENIPDLAEIIDDLNVEWISPPHLWQFPFRDPSVGAQYVKHEGEVYGVIHLYWSIETKNWKDERDEYLDERYYLVSFDGTCREVSREELKETLGDSYRVSDFVYGSQRKAYENRK